MRLIDADALLEEFKDHLPQALKLLKDNGQHHAADFVQGYGEDAINLIVNAPTVQREGWVSVPIEPTKYNPDDNARFSFAYSVNGEGSLYCPECGNAQTIYDSQFDRTTKNKNAVCADCQDKAAPTDKE